MNFEPIKANFKIAYPGGVILQAQQHTGNSHC